MQVSNFPLLLVFLFLSVQISTLLSQGDGIMQRMKVAGLTNPRDLRTFPLSSFPFLYREATEVVSWPSFFPDFVICLLSTKLGGGVRACINNSYFILLVPNGCLASPLTTAFAQADT